MSERFGMEIPEGPSRSRLERLEERHGTQQIQRWADEGMKVETMGLPSFIEDFRERQAERSEEIPYDIERRNERSEIRSENAVQRMGPAGETGVPESVRDVISSSGQSLDVSIQRAMEDRMGDSLGDVRIHTGPKAASACEDINARAFTVGNHVAFNSGEYDPKSAEGQHVLAHELAHVRQQTGGAVSMLPQEDVGLEIDPDPALEREAEETAQRVMEGGELGIQRLADTEVHVQRLSIGDDGPKQATLEGYEDGEFDGSTTEKSLLQKVVAKLKPGSAAREGGRDTVKQWIKRNDTLVHAATQVLALGVSGPVGLATGDAEMTATSHASAAYVIQSVGKQPIRNLNAAAAAQIYDLLIESGYKQLAAAWDAAVERVRSSDDTGTETEEVDY